MHPLHRFLTKVSKEGAIRFTLVEVDQLIQLCWNQFGHDFSGYVKEEIRRRAIRFMEDREVHTFQELYEGLRLGRWRWHEFLNGITSAQVRLFEDPESLFALKKHIFPQLQHHAKLQIWVAGCSTGEELYSLAILLHEAGLWQRSMLFGTDINPQALEQAKSGVFPGVALEESAKRYVQAGGEQQFETYLESRGQTLAFRSFLQNQMVLLPHNLATDPSFNQFHLIVCRNVCSAFLPVLQTKVASLMDKSLLPLGYYVLGRQEQIAPYWRTRAELVDPSSNSYQKHPLQWKK